MSIELGREQKEFAYAELKRVAETLERVTLVGYDSDQILIWSEVPVTRLLNQEFRVSYKPHDMRWNLVRDVAVAKGFSPVDAQIIDDYHWTDPELLFDSPPVPGGLESFRIIGQTKENHIATSRLPYLEKITRDYYAAHLPEHPQERIYINRDSHIAGYIFKADKFLELKVGLVFEDNLGHAQKILERTESIGAFVVLVSRRPEAAEFFHERVIKIPSMLHLHAFLMGNPI